MQNTYSSCLRAWWKKNHAYCRWQHMHTTHEEFIVMDSLEVNGEVEISNKNAARDEKRSFCC